MDNLAKVIKKILLFIITLSLVGFIEPAEAFVNSFNPNQIKEIRTKEALGITDENVLAPETDGSWYLYFDKATAENQFLPYKEYGANVAVFCTVFGSVSPASNNYLVASKGKGAATSCVLDSSWDEATKAGVAAIIDEVTNNNSNQIFSGNTLKDYYNAEIAINKFLYDKDRNKCHLSNTGCTGSIDMGTDKWKISSNSNSEVAGLLAIADAAYEKVSKIKDGMSINVISSSGTTFKLVNDEKYGSVYELDHIFGIISETDHQITNYTSYKVVIKDDSGKEVYHGYGHPVASDNGSVKAIICNNNTASGICKSIEDFEPMAPGNYTVEVEVRYNDVYHYAENYNCTGDSTVKYQSITLAQTESKRVDGYGMGSFKLSIEEETPELQLTVNKKSSDGKGLKGAVIKVVGDNINFNKEYTMSNSTLVIKDIKEYGTYTITEVKAPIGYILDNKPQKVIFNADNKSKTVTITNKPNQAQEIYPGLFIKKEDENGEEISGATIKITGEDISFEKTYIMDSGMIGIDDLKEYGTYKIQEIKAPEGYVLNDEIIKVTLTKEKYYDEITLVNVKKVENKANLNVQKTDEKGNLLAGATLRLLDINGDKVDEWVSEKTAKTFYNLPFGTYTIEEVKAPNGYALSEKKETIKLEENGKTYTVKFANSQLIKVPDTLSNFSKLIIIAGITGLLAGLSLLYFNKCKQEQ